MVHLKSLAVGALLAACVAAGPSEIDARGDRCNQVGPHRPKVANYDDLKFTELPANPIDQYKGLKYNNFFVDQYDGFIHPSSGSQYAMSYDYTKGRSICVPCKGDSFNLKSFYVACNSGYPQDDCKIKVRGNAADGVTTMSQEITYPALDNTKPFVMKKVEFDANWSNLKEIIFEKAEIDGTQNYTGLMIDDLVYEKRRCR